MNCESCGASVMAGSSYCNRCGSSLGSRVEAPAAASHGDNYYNLVQSLVWAIVALSVAGVGVLIGLMTVMKQVLHFPPEAIAGFSAAVFALVLGGVSLFIWMLLRVWRADGPARPAGTAAASRSLPAAVTAPRLSPEPASVTEHTTRGLAEAERAAARGE